MTDLEENLRSQIFGLTMECPTMGNPEECQLHEIRKLSIKDRFEWVESLTLDKCKELYDNHKECFYKRKQALYQ